MSRVIYKCRYINGQRSLPRIDRMEEAVDFASFALIELAGALEAQRADDRRKSKWLLQWRQLQDEAAPTPLPVAQPDEVRPAA